jgi:autotransporter-associated beta strand protein
MNKLQRIHSRHHILCASLLAIVLSLLALQNASAGTEHWKAVPGTSTTTNWTDSANWTGISPPQTYFNEVDFTGIGAVGAPGVINNVFDNATGVAQMPIWQLDFIPTNANYTTLILPGKTLSTAAGNGKMYVGSDQLTAGGWANAVETITITGAGGTLSVGGNLRVGQGCTNGVNSLHNVTLDLSGLDDFIMTPTVASTRLLVCGQSQNRAQGTVYLAKTNSIVLGNDLEIGAMSVYSNTVPVGLYLGQTNLIFTGYSGVGSDTITVGSRGCTNGFMQFNPAFIGGANPPAYAYFGAPSSINGGRVNNFYVGYANGGIIPATGYCDLHGGYVNIMVSTMQLGVGYTNPIVLPPITGTGILTYDNGIIDVNNLMVGYQGIGTGTGGGAAGIGILNISTNCTLKVNSALGLATYTGTPVAGDAGTLNMNGGTLIANLITNGTGTGTINMTNVTWQVVITPTAAAPTNATVTTLNTGGATNLVSVTFASLPSTYPVTIRLVKYQTLGGAGIANMGISLPSGGGYVGYLTNNTTVGAIDVVLTAGASPSNIAWTGADPSGNWDVASTVNWTNGTGAATVYNQLDAVRFDDTASGTTSVNLVGTLTPSGLIVTNASKTYTLGGSGSLAGAGVTGGAIPGGLVKQGTGTLILNNTTADTYLGGINVAGGVLQIGDGSTYGGGSLGPASGAVANSAGLVVNRPSGDTFAVGNVVSGAGGITNAGAGTLQLNSANTFTGPLAINAGIVQLGNNAALGTIAGGTFVASGATLDLNGNNPGYEPITVSGTGADGSGAIINNNGAGTPHLGAVTLAGDVLFGGSQRWDLTNAMTATAPHNVTMGNATYCEWRDLNASTAVNNILVSSGTLGWVGNTTAGSSGTLEVAGGAVLKFYNDGALAANVTKPVLLDDGSTVANGGGANTISAPISLNGYDTFDIGGGTSLTLSGALSGSGTLYKTVDNGLLYITGTSPAYSGLVSLYTGKVYVNGILGTGTSSSITTQPGTALAGTGTNNGPVDIYGGYTPGDAGVLGTNTFASLTLEGSALMTNDLATAANGASDLVVVNGDLTMNNGTIYINAIGGTLDNSRPYTLMTYSGNFNGALPTAQTVASSVYTITLSNATSLSPKRMMAIVSGGSDLLVWNNAGGDGEWNGTSLNWSNTVNHIPNDAFLGGDSVLFNDSITNAASPVTSIDIAGGVLVTPSTMTNNSTVNYSISGGGSISGGASLVKMGPSTLAISNANSFTGPITISGGTVQAASATALGTTTGALTITNGGTLDAGFPLGAKPIFVSGAGVGGNGAIVNNNGGPIYDDSTGGLANTVTLLGDTTFGGTNRWDLGSPTGATLSTGGKPYSVSITSPAGGYKEWNSLTLDPKLTNINVLSAEFGIKGMTNLGDPNGTVTIYTNAQLTFWGGSNYTKNYYVKSGGTMLVRQTGPNFNLNMTLEGGATFHSIDNVKVMTAPVTLLGPVQFLSDSATCTFSNVISGAGGVVWAGNANQFAFAAANTYSGQTIIGNGLTLALLGSGSISSNSLIFFGGTDTNAYRIDVTGRGDQTLTLASGQTLEGAGRVNGALTVAANATVSPGTNTTFGAIGASGAVMLNGFTTLKIYNPAQNDVVQSGGAITYGGTLNLLFLPNTLAAGNSWKLFNAASYSGSFTLSPTSPGSGLLWDTSGLTANGTLRVIAVPPPDITGIAVGGGSVVLSGTNGPASGHYVVLSSTNVALPLNQWQPLATNQFDANGALNWTNSIMPGVKSEFYRLQLQ